MDENTDGKVGVEGSLISAVCVYHLMKSDAVRRSTSLIAREDHPSAIDGMTFFKASWMKMSFEVVDSE